MIYIRNKITSMKHVSLSRWLQSCIPHRSIACSWFDRLLRCIAVLCIHSFPAYYGLVLWFLVVTTNHIIHLVIQQDRFLIPMIVSSYQA